MERLYKPGNPSVQFILESEQSGHLLMMYVYEIGQYDWLAYIQVLATKNRNVVIHLKLE